MTSQIKALAAFVDYRNRSLAVDDAPVLRDMLDTLGSAKFDSSGNIKSRIEEDLRITSSPDFAGTKCYFDNYIFLFDLLHSPFYRSFLPKIPQWKMMEMKNFYTVIVGMSKQFSTSVAIRAYREIIHTRLITSVRLKWMKLNMFLMKPSGDTSVIFVTEFDAIIWINNFEKQT